MSILTTKPDLQKMTDVELKCYRDRLAGRRRAATLSKGGMAASAAVEFAVEFERIRAEVARRPSGVRNDDDGGVIHG